MKEQYRGEKPNSEKKTGKPYEKRGNKSNEGKSSYGKREERAPRGEFERREGKPYEHRESKPRFDKHEERAPRREFERREGKPYEHRESKPRFDKREERAPRGEFERREGKPYEHRESKPRFDKREERAPRGEFERREGKPYEHRESKPRFDKREERAPRGEFERREGKPYEHRESKPRFDKREERAPRGEFERREGKPYEHRESKPRFDKRDRYDSFNRYDGFDHREPRGERPEFERRDRDSKPYPPREERPEFERRDRDSKPYPPRGERPEFERHDRDSKPYPPRGERPEFERRDRDSKPYPPRGERSEFERRDRDSKPYPPRGERPEFERRDRDSKPYPPRGGFERRDGRFGVDRNHGVNANPDGFKIVTARDAALSALRDVVRNGAYSSQALDRSLNAVELSPEDRRLAASIFFFAVENRLYIEWALSHLMQTKAEPLVEDVMHVAAAQILFMDRIPDHAATDEAVKQVRAFGREGLTGLVNGVLRSLTRARDAGELTLPDRDTEPEKYLSVRYSFSEAAAKRLIASYGIDEAEAIASYTPAERAQTVRPNLMKTDIADFERRLDEAGYMWHESAVPGAYRILAAGDLSATDDYRRGMFAIQGESSQLAALAMEAKPGMQILDACAAPGGKTCLMAEAMRGVGRVFAWDLHEHRVELIRAAARRLGLENVRPMTHDARRAPESMMLSMDAVLVDAPCSGLGVIADKPDVKYRLNDEELDGLPDIQKSILDACAKCVRPGGRLVYSTCTILPEENQNQVRAFLERHPEFEMDENVNYLPEVLRPHAESGMISILPNRDGMEGFFIARMRRRED